MGINSAWMCGRHKDGDRIDDEGYVLVGEPQIHYGLKNISDVNIKIAILHHPFDWLARFDRRHVEGRLKNEFDFILNGHQHMTDARQISKNQGFFVHISTGTSYESRIPKDPLFINAYNFVHLDFNAKQGIVFLRRWSDRQNMWIDDTDTLIQGKLTFSLVEEIERSSTSIKRADKISISSPEPTRVIPRQIPPPPADFKGREDEIRDILSNFDKGANITGLRGMPGIGKTVLALVLAERLKDHFPDGQIFINLQGTSKNPLTPPEAMAQVIHAYHPADRIPENESELRGLYLSVLNGKRTLFLLDNAAGKEQVEPLLPPPDSSVLITSRIKFTLPGLKEKDLDVLPSDKACDLLLEIARRIGNRADELAKICGYLPLALRNAASALAERRDLSVVEYERRLKNERIQLKLVDASFSLSYDLLSSIRRKQWCRLSVFPEDFDRNAAAAVWKMDRNISADALSDLVKWSLVDFIPYEDFEDGRYKMHDLARIFAKSRSDSAEIADAKRRHAEYYLKVLSRANELYKSGRKDLILGLELFDREWTNIKTGHTWAESIVGNAENKKGLKFALQMSDSYADKGAYVLYLRLHPKDMIRWRETALIASRRMKNRNAESAHQCNLGNAYYNMGETRRAIEYYEQDLALSQNIEDSSYKGNALVNTANAYEALGETRKAIEYYEQALAINRKAKIEEMKL